MNRIVSLLLVLAWSTSVPGQPGIDYGHKRLFKAIEREWGLTDPALEEQAVADTIHLAEPVQGKFFRIQENEYVSNDHYIFVGRVNSCRAGGCSVSLDEELYGNSEYFDYFILFGPGPAVQDVQVFNYQASYGQEVSARGWLKQFQGYDGISYLKVGKEIDAISGATISVYAITQDVIDKTRILCKLTCSGCAKKIATSSGSGD